MSTGNLMGIVACAGALLLAGCPKESEDYRPVSDTGPVADHAEMDHDHDHEHEHGPHEGHIIELGKHHGELVMDDSRALTIYILGDDVQTAVPVSDAKVILHLQVGDNEQEISFTPAPQEGEAEGSSSRFTAAADSVPESIKDIEDVKGEVELIIGEETVRGEISHDHDHDHHHD